MFTGTIVERGVLDGTILYNPFCFWDFIEGERSGEGYRFGVGVAVGEIERTMSIGGVEKRKGRTGTPEIKELFGCIEGLLNMTVDAKVDIRFAFMRCP
jgi:hypothetical protein